MYKVYRCYQQHSATRPGIKCSPPPKNIQGRARYTLSWRAPSHPSAHQFTRISRLLPAIGLSCYLQNRCAAVFFVRLSSATLYIQVRTLPMYIHHRTNAIRIHAENQPDANIFETNKQHIIRLFKLYHKLQHKLLLVRALGRHGRSHNFATLRMWFVCSGHTSGREFVIMQKFNII